MCTCAIDSVSVGAGGAENAPPYAAACVLGEAQYVVGADAGVLRMLLAHCA